MKKIMMTLAAVFSCAMTMMAEPVSPQAAREAAAKFLKEKGIALKAEAMRAPRRAISPVVPAVPEVSENSEASEASEAPAYYIFNATASKGFVVVSGDDCVGDNLVLGYADSGSFDTDAVPQNMQWWLDEMESQISSLSRLGVKGVAPELHADIDTLLTALWDQGKNVYDPHNPYNALCPVVDDKLCITGCMATALAQVMYYHRWPQDSLAGPLPAYKSTEELDLEELPATTFDWSLMVDDYHNETTEEQQMAVAKLMRYCGQSVQMSYTPSLGASVTYDLDLLVLLFGYDQDVYMAHADFYTVNEWDNLVYSELKEGRPLVYMGFSTGMGHAFVLDGYRVDDGVGLYHVNWGWAGVGNGYFRMALLNPNAHGAGSSNTADGYNRGQRALIGLQPTKSGLKDYGRYLEGFEWNVTVDNDPNMFSAVNTSHLPGKFAIWLAEEYPDGTLNTDNFENGCIVDIPGFKYIDLPSLFRFSLQKTFAGLAPGWHKMRFMQKEVGTDAPFKMLFGPNCFVEMLIDEEGNATETVYHPLAQISASNLTIKVDGLKQRGLRQNVSVPITNNGDEDCISGVLCMVYSMKGTKLESLVAVSRTGVMIEAGGSTTLNFPISINMEGEFIAVLAKMNDAIDIAGYNTTTVKNSPGYLGYKRFHLNELQFYAQDLQYVETPDEQGNPVCSLDFAVANGTTLDYDAYIFAQIYTITEDRHIVPYNFPDVPYLFSELMLPNDMWKYTSIALPAPLEPDQYYVELYIANDFASDIPSDYFPFAGGLLNVEAPTGISDMAAAEGKDNGVWYNLAGRKLNGKPADSGIYVNNGRKLIVH